MPFRVLHTIVDLGASVEDENGHLQSRVFGCGEVIPEGVLTPAQEKRLVDLGAIGDANARAELAPQPGIARFPVGSEDDDVSELQRRLEEANARLEALQAQQAAVTDEDPADARIAELLKLPKPELQAAAQAADLDDSGTKAEIASRIVKHEFPDEE